ncbi:MULTISPECIES: acetylglutamate kinase [Acetobacter]|uniref:Acetylglutamate kinase n=1 Tax=Acetobacter thailandicus TaxID=1502842 RepID=A0ABT3QBP0_9PROT|nr:MULTISPECIES: acetylglutamate kinase [Acetobacter]MBS0959106.1 acetylglutamate kinase [Acetobacter thailandicus]MBS0980460.1 acetylglutamate kinase [Acetobacter thailandicus]MBS0985007.1 acetylglutamate kinase [Acetobacter thailandicus]MBS1003454.1 acetylglutamate kinase [Acetobacter thailandicus]MCX2562712.1 acetylglutamate kinase [Acetobacter thailandicus]
MTSANNASMGPHQEAAVLAGALPYLRRYAGDTIVIKYGGHAMGNSDLAQTFGRDIALLKLVGINPVVVHGGGPQINNMLTQLGIQSTFVNGLRVTDASMVNVIEMVLSGSVNKEVAGLISRAGAMAVGISGKDGNLITARKHQRTVYDPVTKSERVLDLGFVGEPVKVDPRVIYALSGSGLVPVIAPVGQGEDGETYNINADTAAGAVAGAVHAKRLLMLTDVAGVLDAQGNLIPELTATQARKAIADGIITGGMIPKVETCIEAVQAGAQAAVIIDGRIPHACLLELFTTSGSGTLIRAD